MRRSLAFLCFECVETIQEAPGVQAHAAGERIERRPCGMCHKTRSGREYEIISGIKRKRKTEDVEPEPVP